MSINLHFIIKTPNSQQLLQLLPKKVKRLPTSANYLDVLKQLLGLDIRHHQASLLALADNLSLDNKWWLRADPVQIEAENNVAYMLGNTHLAISDEEAQALKRDINNFIAADSLTLITASPTSWYFSSTRNLEIETIPLRDVLYKNLYNHLPRGQHYQYWRRLLTEIQMLLHNSEINKQRIKDGKPQINSLWFWGEGQLPLTKPDEHWQSISSNDPLLKGYADWQAIDYTSLSSATALVNIPSSNGHHLITYNAEFSMSADDSQQNEQQLLRCLIAAIKSSAIETLNLYLPNKAEVCLKAGDLQPWWRAINIF